jgi:hypothetical protein
VNFVQDRFSNVSKEVHDEVHDEGRWKREFDLRELFQSRAGFTEF